MTEDLCPLCGRKLENKEPKGMQITNECNVCGVYKMTGELCHGNQFKEAYKDKRYVLSGETRRITEKIKEKKDEVSNGLGFSNIQLYSDGCLILGSDNLDEIIENADIPKTLPESINKLVLYIGNKSKDNHIEGINISFEKDYSIIYAKTNSDFRKVIEVAYIEMGLLQGSGCTESTSPINSHTYKMVRDNLKFALSVKGWERYEKIKNYRNPRNVFVAMWFPKKEDKYYFDVLNKAYCSMEKVLEELDYEKPFRIDKLEHNNKICEEILERIKRSSFLIADLTGNRGGVYFEAGFAKGLNIPVIFTCKEDDFEGKVHFDVNHYNHIIWKDEKDLKEQLRERIRKTVL